MEHEFPPEASLAGTILAATTDLIDPNFVKTLVYVAEHNAEGAFGLVMNRPLDKKLGDVLKDPDLPEELKDVPLFSGGPVRPDGLIVALFKRESEGDDIVCQLDGNLEQAEAVLKADEGWVRAFAGYAGWGEGQLEGEVAQDAWKICKPDPVLFNPGLNPGLWSVFVSGDERWRKLLPHLPKDPEMN